VDEVEDPRVEGPRDDARDQRAAMLIEAGVALASELALDTVLQRIVQLAVEITGARYGALGVLGEDGTISEFITEGMTAQQRSAIGDLPVGKGILGLLIRERRPIRLPSIGADPRSAGFPPNHPPMGSFLGAPVVARGKIFGNIYLTEKQGAPEFSEEDEQSVVVLAVQAGVAVENARLIQETERAQAEVQRLMVLDERERIAKELHDGVIQSLFAVGMGLQGAAGLTQDDEIERRIESAVGEIDRAIRDLRNYIFGLRPGILADRLLDSALRDLVDGFSERSGVVTVVDVDDSIAAELSGIAPDIVQITRECLSNVGRHAQATTCRVSLLSNDGGAQLVIDDDGVGFDTNAYRVGMGLKNLRERVARIGGDLTIQSSSGEGTTVRVTIPV
jgi:signal transduction histidine kinase